MHDVLIVGGGAAAWSAAIFSARRGLTTLILCKDIGGQMLMTNNIQNYPGIDAISGGALVSRFKKQALHFGVEIRQGEAISLTKERQQFSIMTSSEETFSAASVILAFGLTPRDLGVKSEEKYRGRGIFSSALLYRETLQSKRMAIIGGGNSAIEEALFLSQTAQQVFLIHRRGLFRGDEYSLSRLREKQNVEFLLNTWVKEVQGDEVLRSLVLCTHEGDGREVKRILPVDGVFVHIGFEPRIGWVRDLVDVDSKNQIRVDRDCRTQTEGLFAAGAVTDILYKQVVVSAAEGCKAALSAYRYLKNIEDTPLTPDWS